MYLYSFSFILSVLQFSNFRNCVTYLLIISDQLIIADKEDTNAHYCCCCTGVLCKLCAAFEVETVLYYYSCCQLVAEFRVIAAFSGFYFKLIMMLLNFLCILMYFTAV